MMTNLQKVLLWTVVFTQIILWSSYKYVLHDKDIAMFWGNVPKKQWTPFLISAAIAYILNILLLMYFVTMVKIPEQHMMYLFYSVITYYGLQMFFLPMVQLLPKIYTRIMLFICAIPMTIIAYIAYLHSENVNSLMTKGFLFVSALYPWYHVLFNDAIAYGMYF